MSISIIIMVLCIALSAFFSSTETAYSSASRIKLMSYVENGNRRAGAVLELIENYDKLLTTVLVGNNIVNILLASLATVFFVNNVSGKYGTTAATVTTTLVVLIFGEITPKTLAKRTPEKYAMSVYPLIKGLIVIFTPISSLFSLWSRFLSKIGNSDDETAITDDELLTFVKEAENEGGLDKHESELIQNAIVFDDRQAADILTPRVDVVATPIDADEESVTELFSSTGYSRLPVYEGSLDNIVGVIHQKDFHEGLDEGKSIKDIIQPAVFVAPTMKISNLLRELQNEQAHIAIVVDEYGGTAGIVTMEDILEELVGEIWDEHDEVEEDIKELSENVYLVKGTLLLEEMFDFFDIKSAESEADTVSGWIMEQLGYIPTEGESFEYENLKIEISGVVARRITEVKIEKTPVDESDE